MTLQEKLSADMRLAMADGDRLKLNALKSLLGSLSQAEAVDLSVVPVEKRSSIVSGEGVGSTEVPRRLLNKDDELSIIRAEIAELQTALSQIDLSTTYAKELMLKVEILESYL